MARKAIIKKAAAPKVEPVTKEAARPKLRGGPLAMAADGQVASMREEIDAARVSAVTRFQDGELVLRLSPDVVTDLIGSDRLLERGSDAEFNDLCASIEARGQKQPIHVHPARSDWRPDAAGRAKPGEQFHLVSGRRRLAACKLLGVDVLAIVSAETQDGGVSDLIERFEENTARADLTGYERYRSIGQIAHALPDLSQQEIATMIRVGRSDISIGMSVYELGEDLIEFSRGKVTELPMLKIRPLVKQCKEWIAAGRPMEQAQRPQPPQVQQFKGAQAVTAVTARRKGKKMVLEFDAGAGEEDLAAALQLFLKAHFGNGGAG